MFALLKFSCFLHIVCKDKENCPEHVLYFKHDLYCVKIHVTTHVKHQIEYGMETGSEVLMLDISDYRQLRNFVQ